MVQTWRAQFKAQYGREPRVWFDKACIEQGDIDANLMCLPVFLAGCNTLLVLFSHSYLRRLWCVVELFVFLQMGGTADRVEMMLPDSAPRSSGTAGASHALDVQREIDAFDVRRASCFRREEREKLLTVIEVGFGGLSVFNEVLVALLNAAMRRLDAKELSERLRASRRTVSSRTPLSVPHLLERLSAKWTDSRSSERTATPRTSGNARHSGVLPPSPPSTDGGLASPASH